MAENENKQNNQQPEKSEEQKKKSGENLSEEFVDHIDQIVKTIERNKDKLAIEPNHAMMLEIINAGKMQNYHADDIKAALRRLAREKRVQYGQTMNNYYFKSNN